MAQRCARTSSVKKSVFQGQAQSPNYSFTLSVRTGIESMVSFLVPNHFDTHHVDKTCILLISGGSMVGQNVLDALADRRSGVKLVATNSVPTGKSLFNFDAVYLTPETVAAPAAFERRFSEIFALERPDLVVPCRDDDVAFLAEYKERRPELAKGFLCGNRYTAEASCDKWLSWRFSVDHGLPFAPTIATPAGAQAETFAREHGFPLLVKPRRGYGSLGVHFVFNEAQLRRAATQDGYVIQKYLGDPSTLEAYLRDVNEIGVPLFHSFEGIKHSIQTFIAPDGSPAGNFCTRNTVRNGTSLRHELHESDDATALGEQCMRAFANAGWRGPMNMNCQQTPDGRLVIFEFNGRVTGGTAARLLMGYDEVGLAVKTFAGRELKPAGSSRRAFAQVLRRAVDTAPEPEDVAGLARDGLWQRQA